MATDPDAPDSDQRSRLATFRSSPGYRSGTLVASILVVVGIVTGAIWVAVTNHDSSAPPAAGPTAPSGPVSAQPSPQATLPPGAFGIPTTDSRGRRVETPTNPLGQVLPQISGDTTRSRSSSTDPSSADGDAVVVAPPTGLMWQRVYGEPLPFSTSDGPTSITASGVPEGFSHTPQGAVLAAYQIVERATWAPDTQNAAVLSSAAIVSPAARPVADLLTSNGAEVYAGAAGLPVGLNDVALAVRITSYAPDFTHVEIAKPVTTNNGFTAVSVGVDLAWQTGRWKWVVPAEGVDMERPITGVDPADGWTPW